MKIIIFLLPLLLVACNENEAKYTRSQCITKTKIFWDENLTEKQQLKINNDFYKAKLLMWMNRDKLKILIPDISFPMFFQLDNKGFPKFMYSQYEDGCENKEKMLFIFLEHIKFYVPNFPKYRITNEVVKPSVKTISVSGHWWTDKAKFGE